MLCHESQAIARIASLPPTSLLGYVSPLFSLYSSFPLPLGARIISLVPYYF